MDTFFWLCQYLAQYLHEVHGLVVTSLKYMVIDQLKKQMSDGNSTCPLDPMDKQNSNGHFQVHWIHWIQCTLSFGYLNGTVSTWGPWACHYVIQIHGNWPTEKANVRWKFHLSIESNGQTKFKRTFPGPLDPLDPMDTFVWLSQWHSIYMRSMGLSLRHSNTWLLTNWKRKCQLEIPLVHWIQWTKKNSNGHFQVHWIHWIQWTLSFGYLNGTVSTWGPWACRYVIQIHGNWQTEKANVRWKFHLSIGSNGQTKFQWTFSGPLDPLDPMDTFVWLSQWHSIYMRSIGLSLRHSNTW